MDREEQLIKKVYDLRQVILFNAAILDRMEAEERKDYKTIADLKQCNVDLQSEMEEVQLLLHDLGYYNS